MSIINITDKKANEKIIDKLYINCARQQALFSEILPTAMKKCATDYYLLFRLIDTIEDFLPYPENINILKSISKNGVIILKNQISIISKYKTNIPENYWHLFENIDNIFYYHSNQPQTAQELIEATAKIMANKMQIFQQKKKNAKTPFFLNDFQEFNDYLFCAAGCVGALNFALFNLFNYLNNNSADYLKNLEEHNNPAVALGNYLQTINILRDYTTDKNRNICYIPNIISRLKEKEQLLAIITNSKNYEEQIEKLFKTITNKKVLLYCESLYKIARLHLQFFEKNIEKIITNNIAIKPPALQIFLKLPRELKLKFIVYKFSKLNILSKN